MKVIVILIFTILLSSCQEKKTLDKPINKSDIITMSNISNYDSITKLVKTKGDTLAYDELYYFLMDSNKEDRTDTLMYYSKIMAEKYNNDLGYFYYFTALCEKYDIPFKDANYSSINISSLDKSSKKETEDWLKKMLEKKIITQQQYDSVKR
ncbi:MAG: hypothetical protein MUW56_21140 [Chryseobacterium sp.]|uniref:hypothetical protein n=1 Tax=Chryseobacterium sp. TaxID=1871047 RepID=UPI0025BBB724|nr:hypothetical protein [Chryseobacterium sp.]MCJ7936060.1 hypothetical protein [Chryseobacterium sp.]